jgi:Kef-type K+ transport system membrane component KefB
LTPFYFIRAGSLVSVPTLVAAPGVFLVFLFAKMVTKIAGVYPVTRIYRSPKREAMYTTLLMSTGLTFGTISALFGLSHRIIDQAQYSALVAAVIGSAVVPTLIANAFFLPRHLLGGNKPNAPEPAAAAAERS